MRRAALPPRIRASALAQMVLGGAVAALLTAGGIVAMASDLERSFPAAQIGRASLIPTSPSGKRGVVLVESGAPALPPARG